MTVQEAQKIADENEGKFVFNKHIKVYNKVTGDVLYESHYDSGITPAEFLGLNMTRINCRKLQSKW